MALQADLVDAEQLGAVARGDHEGRHVLGDHGVPAGHGVLAHRAELVHRGEAAQVDVVLDGDVPAQGGAVGEHGVVAHVAVVRHVHVGHDPVAVADAGYRPALLRAAIERHELTDHVLVADLQKGRLSRHVLLVLRVLSHRGVGEDAVVAPDRRRPLDGGVVAHHRAGTDGDPRPDHRVRPHLHPRLQLGVGVHHRGGMNVGDGVFGSAHSGGG